MGNRKEVRGTGDGEWGRRMDGEWGEKGVGKDVWGIGREDGEWGEEDGLGMRKRG